VASLNAGCIDTERNSTDTTDSETIHKDSFDGSVTDSNSPSKTPTKITEKDRKRTTNPDLPTKPIKDEFEANDKRVGIGYLNLTKSVRVAKEKSYPEVKRADGMFLYFDVSINGDTLVQNGDYHVATERSLYFDSRKNQPFRSYSIPSMKSQRVYSVDPSDKIAYTSPTPSPRPYTPSINVQFDGDIITPSYQRSPMVFDIPARIPNSASILWEDPTPSRRWIIPDDTKEKMDDEPEFTLVNVTSYKEEGKWGVKLTVENDGSTGYYDAILYKYDRSEWSGVGGPVGKGDTTTYERYRWENIPSNKLIYDDGMNERIISIE
jgi:hypothetical protein